MAVMTTPQTRNLRYPGHELHLFAEAQNWKQYVSRTIQPYLGQRVLEVGAGIGGMTRYLNSGAAAQWLCLEPDASLLSQLQSQLLDGDLPENCQPVHGTMNALDQTERFDSIVYVDVLEHITDDADELLRASAHLDPGGALIVLSPAHQLLYSTFDRAIGHSRRYSKATLTSIAPTHLSLVRLSYLDSVGLLATLANRFLLRQATPSMQQIRFWDCYLVACSRWLDPLLMHAVGKSVLAVWRRPTEIPIPAQD